VRAVLAALWIVAKDACAAGAEASDASFARDSWNGGDAKRVYRGAARLINGKQISRSLARLHHASPGKI